jgi:hypothetical protein
LENGLMAVKVYFGKKLIFNNFLRLIYRSLRFFAAKSHFLDKNPFFLMRFLLRTAVSVLGLALFTMLTQSCSDLSTKITSSREVRQYDHAVMSSWNEMFLQVERYAAGYRPGPAPRAIAYIGVAAYEGCIKGMPDFNSMQAFFPGLDVPQPDGNAEYHWPSVVNASTALLMRNFFPTAAPDKIAAINALESFHLEQAAKEASPEVIERSVAHGIAVATAVWNYSRTDAIGHDHYLDPFQNYNWEDYYSKDGDWKPTFPGPGKPMGGVWGGARTFSIGPSDLICRPPLAYSANPTSELYAHAIEVYAQNTPTLSFEDEWVGEFWSDDLLNLTFSPGPRWLAIGNQVLALEDSDLETAIYMTAKVGIALNDAAVACWESKFHYNVERPQTYINRVIDPTGQRMAERLFHLDKQHGKTLVYYPSGALKEVQYYDQGLQCLGDTVWYENGSIQFSVHFKSNLKDGFMRKWNTDGKLIFEARYVIDSLAEVNGRMLEQALSNS